MREVMKVRALASTTRHYEDERGDAFIFVGTIVSDDGAWARAIVDGNVVIENVRGRTALDVLNTVGGCLRRLRRKQRRQRN